MRNRWQMLVMSLVVGFGMAVLVGGRSADAGVYPTNKCVSTKQKEAGKYCKSVLKAWAKWEVFQDNIARDADILKAANKLDDKWSRADGKAFDQGAACADTTAASPAIRSGIDTAISDLVTALNSGLDLGDKVQAKCGQRILKSAGTKCAEFLKAESKHIKMPAKDPDGAQRDASKDKASTKFSGAWASATGGGCVPGTTEAAAETAIDEISDAVVLDTTVSPNVDDTQFTTYSPTGTIEYEGKPLEPICIKGTPYHYFAKRGSTNKLLMYYQGGGACWEQLTCFFETCDTNVNPAGSDNPNNVSSGFADLSNPDNPFREWNIVFVSYCSCDIHFGDADNTYTGGALPVVNAKHHGYHNAKVVEKWAREHFVNPEVVFVTGSSAGAYGAMFQAPLLQEVWPASKFHVLADAGNGVITPSFLQNEFNNWNFTANLPSDIPGVLESITSGDGMPAYTKAVAAHFPETNWANYTTAFDGGSGGQTGFYNLMLNDSDPTQAYLWWNASCQWNDVMRSQALDIEAAIAAENDNYRYYIGTGSRHVMWPYDKVYTDTTGGVPTIVDWVNGMLASSGAWTNVEASPSNVTLPGDPISQRRCGGIFAGALCTDDSECTFPDSCDFLDPFEDSGSDIVINCASPSGAFLDESGSVLD